MPTTRLTRRAAALAVAATTTAGLLAAAGAISARPALAAGTATINGGTTFQTITGFGASEGFGQAATVMSASSSVQQQVLQDLYGTTTGAGLTILRNEISADSGDTIEPTAPSSPSATPSYASLASINQDMGQLWFAQQIKADFGVTNVYADAWSAPAFMKVDDATDNGSALCGVSGATCASGNWVQAYANYLKQYAADYSAAGDPLTYVGPENEANLSTSYDSMQLTPAQTVNVLDVLGPTMASSGLSTQVECCATEGWDFANQYAPAIEGDATALADTAVFTSHGYTAAPTSPLTGWTKPAWQTEWSTFESFDSAWDDGSDASGLTWAQHIFTGLDSANLSAFLYWWGSTTPSANGDNEGLLEINGSTVNTTGRLWALGNFSRFVRPGAVRIGATTSDGNLTLDAFKNTNGTITVVALNTGTSSDADTFSLTGTGVANGATVTPYLTNSSNDIAAQATTSVSGGAFSYTLPARSLVTFQIPASGGGGNTVSVTNPGTETGVVGTAESLQIQATDSAAGQTLSYSATGLPAGLSISSTTGLISGTPTTASNNTVTVTVKDTTGATGSASFAWNISGPGTNTVTVTNPGAQSGTVGTAASLQIHATDSSSTQTLSYSATGLPAGLSISSTTGLISGTPTAAGSNSVVVTVKDTTGASGSASFTWTITGSSGGTCHVTYTLNSSWPGGFTAQVTIKNTGTTTINSWSLTFTFPGDEKITSNFNGGFSQTGENATLTNASYNGTIAAGSTITDGFQGTWTSSVANPTSFAINGTACN
jgi:O-glycosyl hydrolase